MHFLNILGGGGGNEGKKTVTLNSQKFSELIYERKKKRV